MYVKNNGTLQHFQMFYLLVVNLTRMNALTPSLTCFITRRTRSGYETLQCALFTYGIFAFQYVTPKKNTRTRLV